MKFYIKRDAGEIPELIKTDKFNLNGWVSPNGTYYGIDGAYHQQGAIYIAVFILNLDNYVLNHGTYFKDSFDSYLLKNGWLEIKETSWLTGIKKPEFFFKKELTQGQIDALFDYCEQFGFNYNNILNKENA